MRKNLNKLYGALAALAFVLCACLFSPPDVSASQSPPVSKVSVCAKSQVAVVHQPIVSVDFNAVLPLTEDLINFRVTKQFSPPITRKRLTDKNIYAGLDRQRPEQPPNRS